MEKFSDEINDIYRRLAKFLRKNLPEDEGAILFGEPDFANKARTALMKESWVILSGVFGHGVLLGTMEFLARNEQFEVCCSIRDFIKQLNSKKTVKKLATSLEQQILTY